MLVVHTESISYFPSSNYRHSRVSWVIYLLLYGMLFLLWEW